MPPSGRPAAPHHWCAVVRYAGRDDLLELEPVNSPQPGHDVDGV